ncbi:MAG: phosphatidylglycerophosphatase A [Thermoprotei archaeon]
MVVAVRRLGRLHVRVRRSNLIVDLPGVCKALSDAPWNGGFTRVKYVVNHQVPKHFECSSPREEMLRALKSVGIPPEEALGLMTAADVSHYSTKTVSEGGLTVVCLATVGLTNARGVGEPPPMLEASPSTVNLIVFCDCDATPTALVNALQSAVEAKCNVFRSLDLRSATSGRPAIGTSTDTTSVVFSGVGRRFEYAGTATDLGYLIGRAVTACLFKRLKSNGFVGRGVLERLSERGVSLEDIVEAAVGGIVGPSPPSFEQLFLEELGRTLSDPNVSSLIVAALRVEDESEWDMVPGLPKKLYRRDPAHVTSDEDIGEMIARYIAGTRGVHNFRHYDRYKPGCLSRLPMFLDDALAGLIGGVASKVFSELGERGGHT